MFYIYFLFLTIVHAAFGTDTSSYSERYISLLETFATFKKYVCNYGSSKQYPPYLLFDRSITSMTPAQDANTNVIIPDTHCITFDPRRKSWHQEILPWLLMYEPNKKFDDNLCYDCSIHHAPGQGEWISKLTRIGGDIATSPAAHNESYYLYEKLKTYSSPRRVKAHTRVCDQGFVHDGRNLLAYVSWTPLLRHFRTNCYSCENHPNVPEVSIYLKPSLNPSLKEYVVNATKEKIKQHIQLTQTYNPALIDQLIDQYSRRHNSGRHNYPTINEQTQLPYITFNIFAQQKILRLFKYIAQEQTTEQITLGDYLKYPGRTYPEYETHCIKENKQLILQHFKDNAQSYHIEKFYQNSLDDYITTIDNDDNYVLHVLFKKNALTPNGLILAHLNQDVIEYGKKEKKDLIRMSIYPKENGTFKVFDNYAYSFLNDINKCAFWHLYKATLMHHPSFKPKSNSYNSGEFPTHKNTLKTLFTYMI